MDEKPLYEGCLTVVGGNFDNAGEVSASIKTILKKMGLPMRTCRREQVINTPITRQFTTFCSVNAKGIAEFSVSTHPLDSERVPLVPIRCGAFKGNDGGIAVEKVKTGMSGCQA